MERIPVKGNVLAKSGGARDCILASVVAAV